MEGKVDWHAPAVDAAWTQEKILSGVIEFQNSLAGAVNYRFPTVGEASKCRSPALFAVLDCRWVFMVSRRGFTFRLQSWSTAAWRPRQVVCEGIQHKKSVASSPGASRARRPRFAGSEIRVLAVPPHDDCSSPAALESSWDMIPQANAKSS